jgi:cobalamin biosynthesis Mg chelatase CobN
MTDVGGRSAAVGRWFVLVVVLAAAVGIAGAVWLFRVLAGA